MINEPIDVHGGPMNGGRRQRNLRHGLVLALAIASASLASCGDFPDDAESVDRVGWALVEFGTAQRAVRKTCGKVCSKVAGIPTDIKHGIRCLETVTDCDRVPLLGATLHENDADARANVIFPAYNEGATWRYRGCGPQAAQNVLNYYGVQLPLTDIVQYIPTFGLIAGSTDQSIATFPNSLASGLQRLFNERVAANRFVVQRRSGVNVRVEIENSLERGNPIILMTDDGKHYEVVTGFDITRVFTIDYPGHDGWRDISGLNMDLPWYSDIFSTVTWGAGGYEPNTVITIEYRR